MRLRYWVSAACVVATAASGVAPAGAATPLTRWDPQQANVPSLGWRGEELRLVKCSPDIRVADGYAGKGQAADWLVEDWSGYPFQPPALEPSTVKFFVGSDFHEGEGCVKADFVSLKAGLAQIKLVISDTATGNPVLKHQFLAGWLALVTPTIREVAAGTGPNDPPGGGGVLGDPSGDGRFFAGDKPGRVQVQVYGSLPLENNFTELGLPSSIQLPFENDGTTYWDDLARSLATTTVPPYGLTPWVTWDIHDDRARSEGHVPTSACGGPFTAVDAVDACLGADIFIGDGRYSRAFGDLSAPPTIGPFDPSRPDETLLPDGKLDAGDVPMPSSLVEVAIAPNQGGSDLGGAGSLAVVNPTGTGNAKWRGVFKCIAYTRDNRCTSNGGSHPTTDPNVAPPPFGPAAHNHYAPFYSRWQPATQARIGATIGADIPGMPLVTEASGNDGPGVGNNFPGYRGQGLYDYWSFVDLIRFGPGGATACLRRHDGNPQTPDFRQRPSGPQDVMVFSDEHGEAQVYFTPGSDFFFDNLGITPNENGGCDLRGIDVLGRADIQATARYPFQKTTDQDRPSGTLTKVVRSRFNKDVSCVPKGPVPPIENGVAFICTATAIDIDGSPFAGERVCFMSNGEGMRTFPFGTPGETEGLNRLCIWLNGSGNGAVEVFCKNQQGNVIAEFVEEGLIRYTFFQCAQVPPTTTTTTTTTSTTTTTTATTTTPTTTTPPPTTTTPPPTTSTTVGAPPTTTTTVGAPPATSTSTRTTTTTKTTPAPKPRIKDVCPNLPGKQAKVPAGKIKLHGKCVQKRKQGVKAAKKKKPAGCVLNGRFVTPCVRGKG
jgi:hypothetical protein